MTICMTFLLLKFVTFNTKRVLEKKDHHFVKKFTQKVLHEINIFQNSNYRWLRAIIRIILVVFSRIQNTLFRIMKNPLI